MKEIGEKLRETRESIGISIEEASEDLKTKPEQITNIENGEFEAFEDVFYLKYFLRDYAKYLGLDYEGIVDEFNEYLFDYTSKISLAEIKEAKKELMGDKKESLEQKIISPYTIERKQKKSLSPIIIGVVITILVLIIGYVIVTIITDQKKKPEDNIVLNVIK